MFSALPSNSDIARRIRDVSKVPKSDISLSGHPKDLSYNSKPRGFYLQPGGAQNLAWWAISSIGSRTQPGGRLACRLLETDFYGSQLLIHKLPTTIIAATII